MTDIPFFIINLEKDKQKKENMNKICFKNRITPTFIKAVYGKELEDTYIDSICNQNLAKKFLGRMLSPGEIGIALSQVSIYKKMIEKNVEIAVVFEDDIDFNFSMEYLINLVNNFPDNWDCVLLGHHQKRSRIIDGLSSFWYKKVLSDELNLIRFAELPVGAYGYIININGARKMIEKYNIISVPIDHWNDKELNLYGISPSIVSVSDEDSMLSLERTQVNIERTLYQRIKDKIQLILKKLYMLESYFLIKEFFIQFKKLHNYKNRGQDK